MYRKNIKCPIGQCLVFALYSNNKLYIKTWS